MPSTIQFWVCLDRILTSELHGDVTEARMMGIFFMFRYYGVIVPSILNLVTLIGFGVLNCILGGQTLAAVTSDSLSWK